MKTTLVSVFVLCFVLLVSVITACKKEKAINPQSCTVKTYSFTADVLPILQTRCAVGQCHVSGGAAPYVATDYNQVAPYAADGRLVKAIKHEGAFKMPRIDPNNPANINADKLADSLIRKIECWVLQGYLNN